MFLSNLLAALFCTRMNPQRDIRAHHSSASVFATYAAPAIEMQPCALAEGYQVLEIFRENNDSSDDESTEMIHGALTERTSRRVVPIEMAERREEGGVPGLADIPAKPIILPTSMAEVIPAGSDLFGLSMWHSQFKGQKFSVAFFDAIHSYQLFVERRRKPEAAFPLPASSTLILEFMAYHLDFSHDSLPEVLLHFCQQAALFTFFPKPPPLEALERFYSFSFSSTCAANVRPRSSSHQASSNLDILFQNNRHRGSWNLDVLLQKNGHQEPTVREIIFLPFLYRLIPSASSHLIAEGLRLAGFLSFAHLFKFYREEFFVAPVNSLVYLLLKRAESSFGQENSSSDGDESVKFET